ncbi:copper resistance protein CopC [Dictyobacter aurantiacus]|uniref:Copper transport protein YcnJ n=1 Tax=Dictyobacter aurantiacus TaxID=1936993 RepID=A0A401ZB15_9CHLR|nr:copper resistance protein CopC [Dictyobacter aurantiacus]GCE04080.1 copper transport protein YcnJ [Dictyobacter aurantiacus]
MFYLRRFRTMGRMLGLAFPLVMLLLFFSALPAEAHAILLRSDPGKDAVLTTPPDQFKAWFSEDLNPTSSTMEVVNASNTQVDSKDAHVTSSDPREMIVSLPANLPPGVYVVVWRTQSADDGHVLRGSVRFSVAAADGTVPQSTGKVAPGTGVLGGTSSAASGQLDTTSFFSFLMITLVDLCVVFWVGAQLWHSFVLQLNDTEDAELRTADQRAADRFECVFAFPTLLLLLLANIGVLIGQGLDLSSGNLGQALSPTTFQELLFHSRFGSFLILRLGVVVIALVLAIFSMVVRERPRVMDSILSWLNLLLGLALLTAVTLSSHAAAVTGNVQTLAILSDWLHLLAASLWVGGMIYLSLVYLPGLRRDSLSDRVHVLISTLGRFSPLALAGVVIMAVSGPFNAVVHMDSFAQLITTAYGRSLSIKTLLVVALLVTSAIHVLIYRPRLKKVAAQYDSAVTQPEASEEDGGQLPLASAPEVKQLERTVGRQSRRLTTVLRWEPVLGVAVLVCTGLMNVFAGSLSPAIPNQPAAQQVGVVKPYHGTFPTKDHQYTIDLTVSPNRLGTNVFTVSVRDSKGKPATNIGVSVYISMLDMDMGTDSVNLQPDGKGHFTAQGDLNMGGHWQLRVEIRTPQDTLHSGTVDITTAF